MLKNDTVSYIQSNRFWMMVVLSSIILFMATCGTSGNRSTYSTNTPGAVAPTLGAVPTQTATASSADACMLLTKDDASNVLGTPVDTAAGSGLGGVCTYTSKNLKIDFTVAGHTRGAKAMATTLAGLGDIALVVPGLGDQAFYNTNSAYALFVLKGDAEYLFSMSDLNYQPLDPTVIQATEKVLAVQLLTNYH